MPLDLLETRRTLAQFRAARFLFVMTTLNEKPYVSADFLQALN